MLLFFIGDADETMVITVVCQVKLQCQILHVYHSVWLTIEKIRKDDMRFMFVKGRIETGRYEDINVNERCCFNCGKKRFEYN